MPVNRLNIFLFSLSCTLEKFALSLVVVQIYVFCCALLVSRVLVSPCAYIGLCLLLCFECAYIEY